MITQAAADRVFGELNRKLFNKALFTPTFIFEETGEPSVKIHTVKLFRPEETEQAIRYEMSLPVWISEADLEVLMKLQMQYLRILQDHGGVTA